MPRPLGRSVKAAPSSEHLPASWILWNNPPSLIILMTSMLARRARTETPREPPAKRQGNTFPLCNLGERMGTPCGNMFPCCLEETPRSSVRAGSSRLYRSRHCVAGATSLGRQALPRAPVCLRPADRLSELSVRVFQAPLPACSVQSFSARPFGLPRGRPVWRA